MFDIRIVFISGTDAVKLLKQRIRSECYCSLYSWGVNSELTTNGPHTEPVVAVIGIDIPFTRIEVQFPSVRRRVERPTPVVTVAATVVERTAIDVACGNRLPADLIT